MNEQQAKKLEIAKMATQLTAALLKGGELNQFVQDMRSMPQKTPALLEAYDVIFDHLERKSVP